MFATDPLSLVFLGCATISGAFLVISTATGLGHGHALHLGHFHFGVGHLGQAGHPGAAGHAGHLGPASHVGQIGHGAAGMNGQAAGAGNGHALQPGHALSTPAASAPVAVHPWTALTETLVGSLNLFSMLTLLFCFGLLGYLFHNLTNVGDVISIVLPALVGGGAGVGVGVLMRRLFEADSGVLTLEDARLEGRIGKVSLPIRPGGVGEVIFKRVGGGRQSIGARNLDADTLPIDTDIVIVGMHDGIADVQAWDNFLRSSRLGTAVPLAALEPGSADAAAMDVSGAIDAPASQPDPLEPPELPAPTESAQ